MSYDLDNHKWRTLSDDIYIGTHKIQEIYVGSHKIYPEGYIIGNYDFKGGHVLIFNNEIHLIGGSAYDGLYHIKWNGSSWIKCPDLPKRISNQRATVCDDRIYLIYQGANDDNAVYLYSGVNYFDLENKYTYEPNSAHFTGSEIQSCNGNLYSWFLTPFFLFGYESLSQYVNGEWERAENVFLGFLGPKMFVCNGNIYALTGSSTNQANACYLWNGTGWDNMGDTPFQKYYFIGMRYTCIGNIVHILAYKQNDMSVTRHIIWNIQSNNYEEHVVSDDIFKIDITKVDVSYGNLNIVAYQNKIHLFGVGIWDTTDKKYYYCGHYVYTPDPNKEYADRWSRLPNIIV